MVTSDNFPNHFVSGISDQIKWKCMTNFRCNLLFKTYQWISLSVCLLVGCINLKAQSILNSGSEFDQIFCDTIYFEYENHKIIVPVYLNGKVEKFIFDTGAPTAIFRELFEDLVLEVSSSGEMEDAMGNDFVLETTEIASYTLGNTSFNKVPAIILDSNATQFLSCFGISGLIGSNSLRNCVVQIDLDKRRLIISNEIGYFDLSNSTPTIMALDEFQCMPYVFMSLRKDTFIYGIFDTGDPDFISLSTEDSNIALKEGTAKSITYGKGRTAVSLGADQREAKEYIAIDTIEMGGGKFLGVKTITSGSQDYNRLGLDICNYGIVTVDFIDSLFYFESHLPSEVIKHQSDLIGKGFNVYPNDTYYEIGIVWKDSPAAKSGLLSGSKIISLNGINFTTRTKVLDCLLISGNLFEGRRMLVEFYDQNGDRKSVAIEEE